MTGFERRRLMAGLLARPHLIVSGPKGIGKRRFAQELALSMVNGQQARTRTIQGHPWWAAETGNITHYVDVQTELSILRLNDFVWPIIEADHTVPDYHHRAGNYVVCVERISPAEVHLYFEQFAQWFFWNQSRQTTPISLRLIGTLDSNMPTALNDQLLRFASMVHVEGAPSSEKSRRDRQGVARQPH